MQRDDIEIINIQKEKRKDREERLAKIKEADVTFLCLPDSAAKEIAQYAPADSRILDTSTAHRIDLTILICRKSTVKRDRRVVVG